MFGSSTNDKCENFNEKLPIKWKSLFYILFFIPKIFLTKVWRKLIKTKLIYVYNWDYNKVI